MVHILAEMLVSTGHTQKPTKKQAKLPINVITQIEETMREPRPKGAKLDRKTTASSRFPYKKTSEQETSKKTYHEIDESTEQKHQKQHLDSVRPRREQESPETQYYLLRKE